MKAARRSTLLFLACAASATWAAGCASDDDPRSRRAGPMRDAESEPSSRVSSLDAAADTQVGLLDSARLGLHDARASADSNDANSANDGDASSPPDAASDASLLGSCYGRCGLPELLTTVQGCACDVACLVRGDCCADKHALCAVTARAPLCTLTGRELDPALCGTDLGWTFSHGDHVEVLFGDSYGADCLDPFPHDDAQGTLPRARPTQLPTGSLAAVPGLACGRLLALDKRPGLGGTTFAPQRLFEGGASLSAWLSETPLTGFSDGEQVYLIARRGSSIEEPLYVAVRDATAAPELQPSRTVYRVGQRFTAKHFKNLTAATVAHFAATAPADNDYGPGAHTVLLFGRDNFAGEASRAMYLAQQRLPLLQPDGSLAWAPSYYAGLEGGKPRWTRDQALAEPILEGDVERPMQHDVAWVPALGKWLMLYGGDVADWLDATPSDAPRHGALLMRLADQPWGPWSAAAPALWREHAAAYLHCDAPSRVGAGERAGCDLDELPDDPAHSYSSGTWAPQQLDFAGCISADLTPSQPNFSAGGSLPCLGAQRGNLYAPSLIDSWTLDLAGDQGYPHAATVYLTLSTWMPYQVILVALTLHLP